MTEFPKPYYVKTFLSVFFLFFLFHPGFAQSAMINAEGRSHTGLNGEWQAIIDPMGIGDWRKVWEEREPEKKTDFVEYAFKGGPVLNVPGDFNTQMPSLTYFEGVVWYKKTFRYSGKKNRRLFLHFGAVNYIADVYLNGKHIGQHEGGYTPFQFEVTGRVKNGENSIVVKVNNKRGEKYIPALGFDWFNYGGITRDVNLIETPATFIEDYFIQLQKGSENQIAGNVKLNGKAPSQTVRIQIPELKILHTVHTDDQGKAPVHFKGDFELWSPEHPKLYKVVITSRTDTIIDRIGFRNIEVRGRDILLNGDPVFLKAVNIHEEMPARASKAYSESDAQALLGWAKDLGCNLVRLSHYPHNEHMVKTAEKMGLMVWDEIPVYQHIDFSSEEVRKKMDLMMREMMHRDKNRCAVVIWSLSNETYPSAPHRTEALIELTENCRKIDSTRLITSVANSQQYTNHTFKVQDPIYKHVDFVSVNEYIGWYEPWQGAPEKAKWELNVDKPLFISEFGAEALYGSNYGPVDEAAYWTEEYQEKVYEDQVKMFRSMPDLSGVCPWILVDYRSLSRLHPVYQKGWNRKGLLSDKGEKKKAWYTVSDYFERH